MFQNIPISAGVASCNAARFEAVFNEYLCPALNHLPGIGVHCLLVNLAAAHHFNAA
jgi:hypothetical protein